MLSSQLITPFSGKTVFPLGLFLYFFFLLSLFSSSMHTFPAATPVPSAVMEALTI